MAAQSDLWGEIGTTVTRSPVSILREQAALLGSKTNNFVEARVDTSTFRDTFIHAFNIVVPALDYTYQLFSVQHGVDMYPIEVPSPHTTLNSEDVFQQWLHDKLSSPETRKIIQNLLSQVSS
jgi:hypothetical protein